MQPKAPDIPCPRLDDEDYMKVWHKYLRTDIERMHVESQCDTWRNAFFALLVLCSILAVLLGLPS